MFTYVMADFMWILTINLQSVLQTDMTICILLTLALHYFYITTFFWMFVEGLYLYMLVVETFNRKSIKSYIYISIGWGIPVIVMLVWSIAKATGPVHDLIDIPAGHPHCLWINATVYDWIFKVPILTVMALNSVFLVMIMWVLITKLRSANNAETQQYRKAAKALMVLIPLLGITYILTIVSSTEGAVAQFFYNLRAFMLSSQGFLVALFYCFLNSEVQNTIRHRLESWSAARTLGGDRRYNYSKDWSPRSRTESIR
ncbi:UNVERIFIED_CONTAM: hypothetical protein PYX00_001721 [Menopon gallinae]|uniref:G-protein coupled receptors family 2 profile 2 domain-containing protein n=1 Tax=Menopon gallinae TaxID=328185 RepID=A0AAW2IEW7_9NEOP